MDHTEDRGSHDVVRNRAPPPARAVRQRISWLPKRLGGEVAIGKGVGQALSRKRLHRWSRHNLTDWRRRPAGGIGAFGAKRQMITRQAVADDAIRSGTPRVRFGAIRWG